jgi:hypothetical protein
MNLLATKGNDYVMVYTYTGAIWMLNMGKIDGEKVKAHGITLEMVKATSIGELKTKVFNTFNPPGDEKRWQ